MFSFSACSSSSELVSFAPCSPSPAAAGAKLALERDSKGLPLDLVPAGSPAQQITKMECTASR